MSTKINNEQTDKIYTSPPRAMCALYDAKACISPYGFAKPMRLYAKNVILYYRCWSIIPGRGGVTSYKGPPSWEGLAHQ